MSGPGAGHVWAKRLDMSGANYRGSSEKIKNYSKSDNQWILAYRPIVVHI
jgi:hypothetical protein